MNRPVPIADLDHRLPEVGRLRFGDTVESTGKNERTYHRPVTVDNWIVTSSNPEALGKLAEVYGGTVEPWEGGNSAKSADSHILRTESPCLTVMLPPTDPQEPAYEKWDGNQCVRRCDGVTMTGFFKDGRDPVERACMCAELDKPFECKIRSHFTFLFPQTTIGVWRLVTGSMAAAQEFRASIEVLRLAQRVGLPQGQLVIQKRQSGAKHFSVPVLLSEASMERMLAASAGGPALPDGGSGVGVVLPGSAVAALEAGEDVI